MWLDEGAGVGREMSQATRSCGGEEAGGGARAQAEDRWAGEREGGYSATGQEAGTGRNC